MMEMESRAQFLQKIKRSTFQPNQKITEIILTTYQGEQEVSGVIARILLGKINPTGKLTQTWPASSYDTPLSDTEEHYRERQKGKEAPEGVVLRLAEGIFFGYRWNDKYKAKPLFAFGHGLSYTKYEYTDLCVNRQGEEYRVCLNVTNTGEVAGDEIVQVYIGKGQVPPYAQMAERQLAGFLRVKNILPGETRKVEIQIDNRSLCYWDVAMPLQIRDDGTKDKWCKAAGERTVFVGASSEDIRLQGSIEVTE